ncbi:adenosylcobinamide-phosphate synthase CbiB [Treponema zioleckii]|uniref:adenosylcobinamide-phosphate synthase CbiB n=1 Tax=Treponema zioleckii TaxID=331680 RepID=UPI00168B5540|nr:adenosylcobinamide-phosphate synthase CbiB [Treponema zioleckii]
MNIRVLLFLHLISIPLVLILDFLFGEPRWIPHPVVIIGRLVSFLERRLRKSFTPRALRFWGCVLVLLVCALTFFVPFSVLAALSFSALHFCGAVSWACVALAFALDVFWGFQSLAARCLGDEALNVYRKLSASLFEGRLAVGRIVGRDVKNLSEEEVIKACVETVAENTTDGIVSPFVFYAFGGAPFALLYKAINTMDSMIGYKNEKYQYFGTAAARLDDFANFIPARLSVFFMFFASIFLRLNFLNGLKIFFRDRYKHASPNSGQTESFVAGALEIRLAGDAVYEGQIERKPFLGDPIRAVEKDDILRTVKLMRLSAVLCMAGLTVPFLLFFFFLT